MPVSDALDVHVGTRSPSWWDEVEEIRRTTNPNAWEGRERPVIALPDLDWASLGLTPRWVGEDSSESVAAIEPSRFHGYGADEWGRFVRGTRSRGELAEPSWLAMSESSFSQLRAQIVTPPVYYLTQRLGA